MNQLHLFVMHHWQLWLALVIILTLIFINEMIDLKQRTKTVSPQEAIDWINHHHAVVIDIRDEKRFKDGHIIDATHLNPKQINEDYLSAYQDKPLIIVCERGQQAMISANQLRKKGFKQVMVLAQGMSAWQTDGLPLSKDKSRTLKTTKAPLI